MDVSNLARNDDYTAIAVGVLLVFLAVFVGVVIWVWTRPKKEMDRHARLPIEED